jgi:hypothetical protein
VSGSWLFVRGAQAVQFVRPTQEPILVVNGPGRRRVARRFDTEAALYAYVQEHATRLTKSGFHFRGLGVERRDRERRNAPRPTSERRNAG